MIRSIHDVVLRQRAVGVDSPDVTTERFHAIVAHPGEFRARGPVHRVEDVDPLARGRLRSLHVVAAFADACASGPGAIEVVVRWIVSRRIAIVISIGTCRECSLHGNVACHQRLADAVDGPLPQRLAGYDVAHAVGEQVHGARGVLVRQKGHERSTRAERLILAGVVRHVQEFQIALQRALLIRECRPVKGRHVPPKALPIQPLERGLRKGLFPV